MLSTEMPQYYKGRNLKHVKVRIGMITIRLLTITTMITIMVVTIRMLPIGFLKEFPFEILEGFYITL